MEDEIIESTSYSAYGSDCLIGNSAQLQVLGKKISTDRLGRYGVFVTIPDLTYSQKYLPENV